MNYKLCFILIADDIHCHINNIANFDDDPLITIKEDDNDSEKDDDIIKPDDNLVLLGHIDGDASILEVFGKFEYFTLKYCIIKYYK